MPLRASIIDVVAASVGCVCNSDEDAAGSGKLEGKVDVPGGGEARWALW